MVKINLLAEGKRPIIARRAQQPFLQLTGTNAANLALLAVSLLGVIAAVVWYFVLESRISKKDGEIRVAQKEVDELRQVIQEVNEFKRRRDELTRKVKIITTLKDNQRGPVQVMDEVSRALPELTWLNSMVVTGRAISLRGTAFNMSAVANFIDNLDKVEAFKEPILQDARAGRGGRTGVYNFRLTMGYSFAKPAPTPATTDTTSAAGAVSKAAAAKAATEAAGKAE